MFVEDFRKPDGSWGNFEVVDGKYLLSRSRQLWVSLVSRCKPDGHIQKKYLTYVGCNMSPLFFDFQTFTDWCRIQVGYGLYDYQLDKDILVKGNKHYGESTCVFVPRQLNTFLCNSAKSRSKFGIGVYKNRSKFNAQVTISGKNTSLGLFKTPEEASEAYHAAKNVEAQKWVERLENGQFLVDERVIERMRSWKSLETL